MAEKRIEPRAYLNIGLGFNILPAMNNSFVLDILNSLDFNSQEMSLQDKIISLIPQLVPFHSWEGNKVRILFYLNLNKESESILKSLSSQFTGSEILFVNVLKSDNRFFTSGYSLKSGKKHKLTSGKTLSYYIESLGNEILFDFEENLKTAITSSLADSIKKNNIKEIKRFLFNFSLACNMQESAKNVWDFSIKKGLPIDVISNILSKNFKRDLCELNLNTEEIKPFQLERTPYCLLDSPEEAFISRLIIERELGSAVTLRRKPLL